MTIDIKGLTQANELARAAMPPRFHVLDQLDRFVEGTAYEGRPGFWEAVDVPLMERAPAIVDPVADDAIRSYIDLILGEHRWRSSQSRARTRRSSASFFVDPASRCCRSRCCARA